MAKKWLQFVHKTMNVRINEWDAGWRKPEANRPTLGLSRAIGMWRQATKRVDHHRCHVRRRRWSWNAENAPRGQKKARKNGIANPDPLRYPPRAAHRAPRRDVWR